MRKLNKKQKKILDEFFETIKHEYGLVVRDIVEELMPVEVWRSINAINDCEINYDLCNNYLNDKELAQKNHFLDISEEVRSFVREKWIEAKDPYKLELRKIRQKAKEMTLPNKVQEIKTDLKRLLEDLNGI